MTRESKKPAGLMDAADKITSNALYIGMMEVSAECIADLIDKHSGYSDLLAACKAFVEAWDRCLQLEKTDVAVRMAREAIARAEGMRRP